VPTAGRLLANIPGCLGRTNLSLHKDRATYPSFGIASARESRLNQWRRNTRRAELNAQEFSRLSGVELRIVASRARPQELLEPTHSYLRLFSNSACASRSHCSSCLMRTASTG
jgi:hypothetical protein